MLWVFKIVVKKIQQNHKKNKQIQLNRAFSSPNAKWLALHLVGLLLVF